MGKLSEQEKRINKILNVCDDLTDKRKPIRAFLKYLKENLEFPIEVMNMEDDEKYLLYDIEDSGDTMYGLLGKVKLLSDKRRRYELCLGDLEAKKSDSKNFVLLDDYSVWFGNS
jgi:hypothetical protein